MPRSLSWSAALRDLRSDRAVPNPVREERLRTTAGLRGSPALSLTAWRGRSGRRYVCAIDADPTEAVVIAVKRCPAGIASIVTVEAFENPTGSEAGAFCRVARLAGATELHVHRLAETAVERAAIVDDLR